MNRYSMGEPKPVWYHGSWYWFPTIAERDEFIREMNEYDQRRHEGRTGEYIA